MTTLATVSEVESLEERLDAAIRRGHAGDLEVIGYGEITLAVKLSTPRGDFACKRLVPFSSRESAERTVGAIQEYVEALRGCGIDVIRTEEPILERPVGHVVYIVQPMLSPGTLGPVFLRGKSGEQALRHVERIFERIKASVSPSLAPDGQLSNWAFEGDRLVYIDVGTPFLRDADGHERFDFTTQTRALPLPIRLIVDRFFVKGILDNYHSTRGQALDFLGNLIKEGLPDLIPALIPLANRVFELSPELTEKEIQAHYKSDAQTYAFIQWARRADRWVYQNLLRRPYPYLLPPRLERFGSVRHPDQGS